MDQETKMEFKKVHEEFHAVNTRLARHDQRFEQIDQRFEQIDQRFEKLELSMHQSEIKNEERDSKLDKVLDVVLTINEKLTVLSAVKGTQEEHEVRISALEYAVRSRQS